LILQQMPTWAMLRSLCSTIPKCVYLDLGRDSCCIDDLKGAAHAQSQNQAAKPCLTHSMQ